MIRPAGSYKDGERAQRVEPFPGGVTVTHRPLEAVFKVRILARELFLQVALPFVDLLQCVGSNPLPGVFLGQSVKSL
jgi:hypothetical protein